MALGLCLAFCLAPWPQLTSAPPPKWACGHSSPTPPRTRCATDKGNHCARRPWVCPACRIQAGKTASWAHHQPHASFLTPQFIGDPGSLHPLLVWPAWSPGAQSAQRAQDWCQLFAWCVSLPPLLQRAPGVWGSRALWVLWAAPAGAHPYAVTCFASFPGDSRDWTTPFPESSPESRVLAQLQGGAKEGM